MTYDHLSDDEARGMLVRAARAVADMLQRVRAAIDSVDQDKANAVHAARVADEAKDIEIFGVRGEREALRAHPLYPLLALSSRLTTSLERILAITNPNLHAERRLAELRAADTFRQTQLA